jgi:hypothetical protein
VYPIGPQHRSEGSPLYSRNLAEPLATAKAAAPTRIPGLPQESMTWARSLHPTGKHVTVQTRHGRSSQASGTIKRGRNTIPEQSYSTSETPAQAQLSAQLEIRKQAIELRHHVPMKGVSPSETKPFVLCVGTLLTKGGYSQVTRGSLVKIISSWRSSSLLGHTCCTASLETSWRVTGGSAYAARTAAQDTEATPSTSSDSVETAASSSS